MNRIDRFGSIGSTGVSGISGTIGSAGVRGYGDATWDKYPYNYRYTFGDPNNPKTGYYSNYNLTLKDILKIEKSSDNFIEWVGPQEKLNLIKKLKLSPKLNKIMQL